MSNKKILAFSSSRVGTGTFLEDVVPIIEEMLGTSSKLIAFIPFASVDKDDSAYADILAKAFAKSHHTIIIIKPGQAAEMISAADAIMVGGGNTFKLLHDIYAYKLIDCIRNEVDNGKPYIGWSAGANIVAPTIATTNDMPVIEPKSFNALGLLPFQINPHYFSPPITGYNGETRDQRLNEFLLLNPGVPVVGLPEGTALHLENNRLLFTGITSGVLFTSDVSSGLLQRREITAGEDISFLL